MRNLTPVHTTPSECTINPDTLCCDICGVDHSEECPECGNRGFHTPACWLVENGNTHSTEVLVADVLNAAKEYGMEMTMETAMEIVEHDAVNNPPCSVCGIVGCCEHDDV